MMECRSIRKVGTDHWTLEEDEIGRKGGQRKRRYMLRKERERKREGEKGRERGKGREGCRNDKCDPWKPDRLTSSSFGLIVIGM